MITFFTSLVTFEGLPPKYQGTMPPQLNIHETQKISKHHRTMMAYSPTPYINNDMNI